MKHPAKTPVLAFVTAAVMGMPCMARNESHGLWKRLPDMAVPRWEAGSVVFENKITVLTSRGRWKHAGELPQSLSTAVAGIIDGKLYLAGGSPNGAPPQPRMCVRIAPD